MLAIETTETLGEITMIRIEIIATSPKREMKNKGDTQDTDQTVITDMNVTDHLAETDPPAGIDHGKPKKKKFLFVRKDHVLFSCHRISWKQTL